MIAIATTQGPNRSLPVAETTVFKTKEGVSGWEPNPEHAQSTVNDKYCCEILMQLKENIGRKKTELSMMAIGLSSMTMHQLTAHMTEA